MKRIWSTPLIVSLILVVTLMTACGGGAPAEAPRDAGEEATETAGESETEPSGDQPTIRLAENNWSASALNVAVAKILLEEELGYPVEVVNLDENAQWSALATGDLDASLEVWPSGHTENMAEYIDSQGTVENVGPLGPVGKIGWYMPSYVVEEHPELATWEGFTDPELAALFQTAETGDKGQFLGGDPSFVQYDEDIINNLGLNLQVVHAGSGEAILAALDSAVSRQEPILFYFWTPHSVHAQYDLTEVELPAYSEECYAEAETGGVACDYPPDNLFKIVSAELAEKAPEAYQFIQNMNYTTEDQIEMIAAVELEGKTPQEAAQEWIDNNQETWQQWLPE